MTTVLQDTLSGERHELVPLEPGHVRIYSCGPTVYGPAHVGNFRSFLFADLLVRHLRHLGLRVTWVMNITDVDDRLIANANAAHETVGELADRWLERFRADFAALRMTPPDVLPRATEHIAPMVAIIETLLEKGHAYRTDDGSIFYRISSWPAYGRLARLDPEQLKVGERVEADDYGKDDARDFALWKGPKAGEPSWDTAIGPGRPGWHIECSAMSMQHLGESFDIHTGGVDLIFPHHEDEIAQSEAATGKPFVRTWLHCAHLRLDGAKMAKRTGNVSRVADLLDAGTSARALRYALISVHYRQGLDFSDASLDAARSAIERLDGALAALVAYREDRADDPSVVTLLEGARERFDAALDDDLNASAGLAAVFDLVREANRRIADRSLSTADAARVVALLRDLDAVLAVLPDEAADELPAGAAELLAAREAARARRDWAESDRLRGALLELGVAVEDSRDGQRWRLAESPQAESRP
jgi:cysteinyl-tRNA synthetase